MNNKNNVQFCTCGDLSCLNHPRNHNNGCTKCIAKNLAMGEIPTCFFKKVDPEYNGPKYFYKDFASLVKSREKDE